MVMSDRISAPGYAEAFSRGDYQITDAYSCCRFDGDKVPHIDPEKEVRAERLKLGDTGANIPLTTVEDACERLDTGDSDSIIQQYSEEIKQSVNLGIPISEAKPTAPEAESPAPASPVRR
jgi:capsid protein